MLFSFSSRFSCAYIQLSSQISVLLKDHYLVILLSSLHCYSSSVKEEKKILREKKSDLPKLRPLSLHALVSKIVCISKDWLSIFSVLNSWSFKARDVKMLLQVNVLCNFTYNSPTKLNHRCHIKNTHFKVIPRITDLFFEFYFLLRKHVSLFLFFPPFRSLILGPDFQLSTQDSINISVSCRGLTPLQMNPRSV